MKARTKKIEAEIRSVAIRVALEYGIDNPRTIRDIIRRSRLGVKKMSVAGVKAAISRGC